MANVRDAGDEGAGKRVGIASAPDVHPFALETRAKR